MTDVTPLTETSPTIGNFAPGDECYAFGYPLTFPHLFLPNYQTDTLTFCTDIPGPQRMNPTDFGDRRQSNATLTLITRFFN